MARSYAALGLCAGIVAFVGPALSASAEYVRDGIRINLRTQPGNEYRIIDTLASGDRVSKLSEVEDWIRVRVDGGEQLVGWVPKGYLTRDVPASLRLPQIQTKFASARKRIEALEQKLEAQAEAVLELETLRTETATLRTENLQLSGAERWRSLGMGALIAFVGVLVGIVWPRGGTRGARRIKL
jgi:SH3 domain protein